MDEEKKCRLCNDILSEEQKEDGVCKTCERNHPYEKDDYEPTLADIYYNQQKEERTG